MLIQEEIARGQIRIALARYHALYVNDAYKLAVAGKSVEYANALIDEALAICGHPHYRLSRRHWAEPAQTFLEGFSQAQ